jgi:dTDP-4-dehydrorhamnose 3,5-epimerase-like enzyme
MDFPPALRILRLPETNDPRGSSFTVPLPAMQFLGAVRDIHISDTRPGSVRGNHYHQRHREVLCIRHFDTWSLHWKAAVETDIQTESFAGSGFVVVEVDPSIAHAIRNDGKLQMQVIGLSDREFDPQNPDSCPLKIA